jgi:hypothetical protein
MTVEDSVGLRDCASEEAWARRLRDDGAEIERCLPPELRTLHRVLVGRARAADALGLVLTGSTARSRRTGISDLDYHLVGPSIPTRDLSGAIDLHVLSSEELDANILSGDDFVQWSLRFGLIVFDHGVLYRAARRIVESGLWPDPDRKLRHAAKSVDLARRFVASGDVDGALVQVRTALSLAARARLLCAGIFPRSRAELPDQLSELGFGKAGNALAATIHEPVVTLDDLADAVSECEALIATPDTVGEFRLEHRRSALR